MSYRSFHTRARARIFRHDAYPLDVTAHISGTRAVGVGTVIAAGHNKTLSSPSGSWSMTVKGGTVDLMQEVGAGDWVVLWWERNGEALHGVLGIIDTIQRGRRSVDGATVETFTITGRDIGKVFESTVVWWNEYENFSTNVGGKILGSRHNYIPGGTPDKVCQNVVDAFLGGDDIIGGAWKLPFGLEYIGDHFSEGLFAVIERDGRRKDPAPVGTFPDDPAVLRGELFDEVSLFQPEPGTRLHDVLAEWSNPILNELFYDVLVDESLSPPDKPLPAMYLRERPFPTALTGLFGAWFALPTVRLERRAGDVVEDNLGTSDLERVNLIMLYASGIGQSNFDQYVLYPPSYDEEDVKRHGIRKFEQSTRFCGVGGRGGGTTWMQELAEWHTLMASWYGLNDRWLSGNVKVPYVLPEARIGRRLIVDDGDDAARVQAYIEGVNVTWSYPRGGNTALTVTRGYRGTDEQLVGDVVDKVLRFKRRAVKGIPGLEGASLEALRKWAEGQSQ